MNATRPSHLRILVGFLLLGLAACLQAEGERSLCVGQETPSFMLPDLQNKYVALRDLAGAKAKQPTPVIVNFWATYCVPCRKEMPHLLEAAKDYGDKVRLILIAMDQITERPKVEALARQQGFAEAVLLDPYQNTARNYGVDRIPLTFVIDPAGKLVGMVPFSDDATAFGAALRQAVDKALAAPPTAR
jgi:thiol-disulfide isomerase/thioredoxin